MAALYFENGLHIQLDDDVVSKPYIDMTIKILQIFGIAIERDNYTNFNIKPGQRLQSPNEFYIEGDASAASYFLAAGSLPGCGPVTIKGLGSDSIQGDLEFISLLQKMGSHIELNPTSILIRGPKRDQKLKALDVDMNHMPDAAMTLAVLALFCEGTTYIHNIENLRVKESERIQGLHKELAKLGAGVVEKQDALYITAPIEFIPSIIETYNDHRMAMAFALAAYGTNLQIQNPECVSKTYRNFFNDFLPMMRYADPSVAE